MRFYLIACPLLSICQGQRFPMCLVWLLPDTDSILAEAEGKQGAFTACNAEFSSDSATGRNMAAASLQADQRGAQGLGCVFAW